MPAAPGLLHVPAGVSPLCQTDTNQNHRFLRDIKHRHCPSHHNASQWNAMWEPLSIPPGQFPFPDKSPGNLQPAYSLQDPYRSSDPRSGGTGPFPPVQSPPIGIRNATRPASPFPSDGPVLPPVQGPPERSVLPKLPRWLCHRFPARLPRRSPASGPNARTASHIHRHPADLHAPRADTAPPRKSALPPVFPARQSRPYSTWPPPPGAGAGAIWLPTLRSRTVRPALRTPAGL